MYYTVVNTFALSSLVTDSQGLAVSVKDHAGHYGITLGDAIRLRLWDHCTGGIVGGQGDFQRAAQREAFPLGGSA